MLISHGLVLPRMGLSMSRRILAVSASSLLTSLVAYWKLEEASGTRVDATGRGNDLTDNNTVTQATGIVGNAAQFTAANSEYLSHADNADLSTGNVDFTVAAWVYLDSKPASVMGFVTKGSGGSTTNAEYSLQYLNTSDRFRLVVFDGGSNAGAAVANNLGSPSTSTWYFVVAWHDSVADTVNIQVNNGTVNSSAYTFGSWDSTEPLWIGRSSSGYQNGRIDAVGFWKRVLTAGERTSLYNGGAGLQYPFPGT